MIFKQDLALNNLQLLICQKTKPNHSTVQKNSYVQTNQYSHAKNKITYKLLTYKSYL